MSSPVGSSAGASRRRCARTSSSRRWSRPSTTAAVPASTLVHHSDRGAQYLSMRYTERLAEAEIAPSVGSRGDSYDNALAESIIGLFKTEVIQRKGPWRQLEAVEFATLTWVDWFNTRRLLEPIGYVPPAEYEANYYAQTSTGGARRQPDPSSPVDATADERLQDFLRPSTDSGGLPELNA